MGRGCCGTPPLTLFFQQSNQRISPGHDFKHLGENFTFLLHVSASFLLICNKYCKRAVVFQRAIGDYGFFIIIIILSGLYPMYAWFFQSNFAQLLFIHMCVMGIEISRKMDDKKMSLPSSANLSRSSCCNRSWRSSNCTSWALTKSSFSYLRTSFRSLIKSNHSRRSSDSSFSVHSEKGDEI